MATTIECALMAGASYISTRGEINQFPVPAGWMGTLEPREVLSSGFEATSFIKGSEIVISFAGTYLTDVLGDQAANVGLATGAGSVQLLQAADYYLRVRALYPTATITLTGHSLGGGLAALLGVFFRETAMTFDQAPFANSAGGVVGQVLLQELVSRGYTAEQLSSFTDFLSVQSQIGGVPNSNLVTNISVQGEFLTTAPWTVFPRIGFTAEVIPDSAVGVSGFSMHAQSLLTAFLQSRETAPSGKALNEVSLKLTDLLAMIFDESLFATSTDTDKKNLLEHLVRHQTGSIDNVPVGGDGMITRFTEDMWKLAQDGGLTMSDGDGNPDLHDVSKTLIAFAMQKYYDEQLAPGDTPVNLFSDLDEVSAGSGGLYFDRKEVAVTLNDAKGYGYFKNYLLENLFKEAEGQLIRSRLPAERDWYVQAGANGMDATDTENRGAFMLRRRRGSGLGYCIMMPVEKVG